MFALGGWKDSNRCECRGEVASESFGPAAPALGLVAETSAADDVRPPSRTVPAMRRAVFGGMIATCCTVMGLKARLNAGPRAKAGL